MNTNVFKKNADQRSKESGFTLVELIVVIAIIAILAVVSVFGYTKYMEDARRSNDTQLASQLTTVLRAEARDEGLVKEDLDAQEVRRLLNKAGEEINLSPASKNSGFFYDSKEDAIVLYKYNDAVELEPASSFTTFSSPEEVFGKGLYLLTEDEIPVPFAVSFIRSMADSGSRVGKDYQDVLKAIDKYEGNIFARLSSQRLEGAVKTRIVKMLEYYSPQTTLFVNNTSWVTLAADLSSVDKIVFGNNITNLPAFNAGGSGIVAISELKLPRTMKTAEDGAMPSSNFESVVITSSQRIRRVAGTNPFGFTVGANIFDDAKPVVLQNYRGFIDATNVVDKKISVDLKGLNALLKAEGIEVESVRLVLNYSLPSLSKIYIYTKDGLYGVATPALVPLN